MIPFLTGSRKYGPFDKDSDIDIVMLECDAEKLKELAESIGIETEDVFHPYEPPSFYINIPNLPQINIITVTEDEAKEWRFATDEMSKIEPIINRDERIMDFRSFRFQTPR